MGTTRRHVLSLAVAAAIFIGFIPAAPAADEKDGIVFGPLVFAAASLKDALDAINAARADAGGKSAVISYAASSVLAKQIEQDAPADIFISADLDWMDFLAARHLIKPETRFNLLGNTLVLIASANSTLEVKIEASFPLASLLGDGKLAMANTDSVPAGKYGKTALSRLGVWDGVKHKIAQAENVRAALALVSRGEAPLGIVYGSDAKADPNVKVLGTFPADSHPEIIYPAAVLAKAKSADAEGFLGYLKTPVAKDIFEAQGFTVLSNR
jgi:molybdate transport system substrate-binding protein